RVGVVAVADQVGAALDLGGIGAEERRIGRRGFVGVRVEVRLRRARATEVRVREVDAGVDDGDLDALTVQTVEPVPDRRGADQRNAVDVVRRHELDRADGGHVRDGTQRVDLVGRDAYLDPVVRGLVLAEDLATECAYPRRGGVLHGP